METRGKKTNPSLPSRKKRPDDDHGVGRAVRIWNQRLAELNDPPSPEVVRLRNGIDSLRSLLK